MPADTGGPYVAAAFFCEKVLIEQDNTPSIIRIFDKLIVRLTATQPGAKPPPNLPQMATALTLFLLFRAGKARGRATVNLAIELPSGMRHEHPQGNTIHFEGDGERGAQIIAEIEVPVVGEGLYWFEVSVDGDFLTKIPLRVQYQPS